MKRKYFLSFYLNVFRNAEKIREFVKKKRHVYNFAPIDSILNHYKTIYIYFNVILFQSDKIIIIRVSFFLTNYVNQSFFFLLEKFYFLRILTLISTQWTLPYIKNHGESFEATFKALIWKHHLSNFVQGVPLNLCHFLSLIT